MRATPLIDEPAVVLRTNLATNPSVELNTNRFSPYSTATPARVSTWSSDASWSYEVTKTVATNQGAIYLEARSDFAQGDLVTVGVDVWCSTASTLQLSGRITKSGAPTTAEGMGAKNFATVIGVAQRVSITYAVPAPNAGGTILSVGFQVIAGATWPVGAVLRIDGVTIERGTTSGSRFSGSTPDTVDRDYAWTGTPEASTSTESTIARTTNPGALALTSSHALTCDAYLFTSQPTPHEAPTRRLALLGGTYTDDVAKGYARGYELRVRDPLVDITPGSWVQVRIGAVGQTRDIYILPSLFVSSALAGGDGTILTCVDIGAALDEVVFERDATLTGTLRSLAAELTTGVPTLTHPPSVAQVPDLTIPTNTVAEFGKGRWRVLLAVADQLGVDLLWTDDGDLLGIARTSPPASPVARLDAYLVDAGQAERNRAVVRAVVQVARDKALPELVGVASVAGSGVTVADRQDGDATTTQAQADALAAGLLARRRSERNVREIDVAPAPWLEAGTDTVTLDARTWSVRAMAVQLPSLATALTLRDAS